MDEDAAMPTSTLDEEIRSARHRLGDALDEARQAAERALAAVTGGELPDAAGVAELGSLCTGFLRLAELLNLSPDNNPALKTIDAAIAERDEREQRSATTARLQALPTLNGGPSLAGPIAALRELVEETLDHLAHAGEADALDGLLAFADLIDLIAADGPAGADTVRVMELQGRCSPVLPPPQLAQLMLAALIGRLAWARTRQKPTDRARRRYRPSPFPRQP